ncbi:sensor histidine kinase [Pseudonocardia alaniniphila]|uniref:histidine kinase n=1 Tax=Pseudonocardia alaniniphila TaxID=75291 RepID=A0ABS9TM05_9PSEU|nr:HAMP domain-containing sensor histidine kinase [Pseudonocardia alaniniphila]MCH6169564.1 HAMP domain-containing histidine kinase [Pseudonocardia alaniniphila]
MRRRILVLVGATTSLVLIAFLVPLALLLRTVAADRAVQAATVEAQSLSSLVGTTDRAALALAVQQLDLSSPDAVSVFLADGAVLGSAADRTPLVELGALGTSSSAEVDGGREIVFAVRDQIGGAGVIRSFVPDAELGRGVPGAWLMLGALGVGLLGLSLAVADSLARSLVRSTTDLAAVSHRLAIGELDARADSSAPSELGVVAESLNGLAARITDLLREERETVADLAHRVRTPLTALRLDAEALSAQGDAARIGAGVDAVQRAVTQAIEQARRRGTGPGAGRTGSDAAAVVRERVEFWAVLAEDTDRETVVDIAAGPLPVALGEADLAACVDALLGNVFAHTPDGTSFAVRLTPRPDGGARLVVADSGPGLSDGSAVRRGTSGAGSTGLGLDIARRSAEQAGGQLELSRSADGGLEVVVDLGGPDTPA